MPADAQGAQDQWCDVEGSRIALFCWVEQIIEHSGPGGAVLPITPAGQVLGRGPGVLYVRFAGERQLISVPPELLRLLPNEPEERWW